jgi:uncharacterized protein
VLGTLTRVTTFDLRSLHLRPGEAKRERVAVELAPLELGGQRYVAEPDAPEGELTVTRASSGTVFELRLPVRLRGPCFRCLEDAVVERDLALREYQATSPGESDELVTPYLAENKLDLSAWVRDALVLSLPDKILCRPDCAGLCDVCGRDLNLEPHEHAEAEPDPRWAALAELKDRL